jgi:hypothetical protein
VSARISAAAVATLALGLAQAAGGCVCEQGQGVRKAVPGDNPHDPRIEPQAPPLSKESVIWDFRKRGEPPLLSLWPKDPTAPGRRKSEVRATKQGDVLLAETESNDAWLLWQFDTPLHIATLSAELSSPVAGKLQLYWTSVDCPIFAERCSHTQPIVAGRQFVDLVAGTSRAIREIRLDLPEARGLKVEFFQLRLYGKPVLRAATTGHEPSTTLERGDDGLVVNSTANDPWITLQTPWLEASRVEMIEVEIGGTGVTEPQLFWRGGACREFGEQCSVKLSSSGAGSFRARFPGAPAWAGKISALRLDPSTQPGRYVVARLSLVRPPVK